MEDDDFSEYENHSDGFRDLVSCGSCSYWGECGQEKEKGWCQRYPPIVNIRNGWSVFPVTNESYFCGEHSKIEVWRRKSNAK